MIFMDFEKPLEILLVIWKNFKKIAKGQRHRRCPKKIKELELKISDKRKKKFINNLTGWQM